MLGGVLQLAVQMPALARIGCLPRIGLAPGAARARPGATPACSRVLRQMAPALLGVSVAQISLLINTQIASHVAVGAVSWLTYADRLMEFPTALLGVALGVVLLPQLSAAQARDDAQAYSEHARLGPAPGAAAGAALRGGAAGVSRGRWWRCCSTTAPSTPHDVRRRRAALMGYGVGLMGLVGVKVLAPGFYARQDIRTPVQHRHRRAGRHAGDEPACSCPGSAMPGWRCRSAWARWSTPACCCVGLLRRGVYRPRPGWGGFHGCAWRLASAAAGRRLLAWAAQAHRLDRPAGALGPARRLRWRWCWRGVALLYFGVLAACGLRPRHF